MLYERLRMVLTTRWRQSLGPSVVDARRAAMGSTALTLLYCSPSLAADKCHNATDVTLCY